MGNRVLKGIIGGVLLVTGASAQTLNFYYGNMHAHSSYSDGNKDEATNGYSTPYQDFQFAKHAQHFDFMGISEHNHSQAGMVLASYAKGLAQADSANVNGTFIAMYGMEYGVIGPPGGHLLIYGYNQLIGWETGYYNVFNAKLDYASLWPKIANTPGAFASMAHPDITDYDSLYFRAHNVVADSALRGCAIRSGPAFSVDTQYNDAATSSYESRYKDALKRGYHVGAVLDHDNHYLTFGIMAKSRTVVLASSLTRTNILDAFKNRRTQSSDDWNVKVNFTVKSRILGSIFSDTGNAQISVTVTDPDLEAVSSIVITSGIPGSGTAPTTLTSNSGQSTFNYTHNVAIGNTYYYYAVVTQADGDKIYTAPIWYTRSATLPVSLLFFRAELTNDRKVTCSWETAQEINAKEFAIERSTDGEHFEAIGTLSATNSRTLSHYDFMDEKLPAGVLYYRLRETDYDGTMMFSSVVMVHTSQVAVDLNIYPNPSSGLTFIEASSSTRSEALLEIMSNEGRIITTRQLILDKHTQSIPVDFTAYPQGLYLVKLTAPEQVVFRKIIKSN